MKNFESNKKDSTPNLYIPTEKELARLCNKSRATISRYKKEIQEARENKLRKSISLAEFCRYYGYPLKDACRILDLPYYPDDEAGFTSKRTAC